MLKVLKKGGGGGFGPHDREDFFLLKKHYKNRLSSKVSTSTITADSQLKCGNTVEKHNFQHILGLGINLNNILFQGGNLRNMIILALTLFFLKLDGNT